MNTLATKKAVACLCAAVLAGVLCVGCASSTSSGEAPQAAKEDQTSSLANGVTDAQEVVYCLYFGLTDKDSGVQELTMAEAKELIIPLFVEAGSGYTVYEAEGGYALEDGTIIRNDTLVFDSTHGDDQAILNLIDKAKQALNIESVYVESKTVGYKMYGGVISGVQ